MEPGKSTCISRKNWINGWICKRVISTRQALKEPVAQDKFIMEAMSMSRRNWIDGCECKTVISVRQVCQEAVAQYVFVIKQ